MTVRKCRLFDVIFAQPLLKISGKIQDGGVWIAYNFFMYVKRFLEWIVLKERLHSKLSQAPYVNEGEIWWASLGENVGSEINGKSNLFSRPVIIFKKLTHDYYFVIPVSTKKNSGSWYVPTDKVK